MTTRLNKYYTTTASPSISYVKLIYGIVPI